MPESKCYASKIARQSATHTIRGVDYRVSEWGSPLDPMLVFLHGWGDTGSCFQFVVDEFRTGYFVVAPDWRGFGESVSSSESYWFPDYLADLHELLQIYSPDKPAQLIGHSMGANVAALYAGVFPERIAALVNLEGFGLATAIPKMRPDTTGAGSRRADRPPPSHATSPTSVWRKG